MGKYYYVQTLILSRAPGLTRAGPRFAPSRPGPVPGKYPRGARRPGGRTPRALWLDTPPAGWYQRGPETIHRCAKLTATIAPPEECPLV